MCKEVSCSIIKETIRKIEEENILKKVYKNWGVEILKNIEHNSMLRCLKPMEEK
jgi:ribosomal protein S25